MKKILCAYCGTLITKQEKDKEHVFPKCLYPPSKANSKVQRLRIPSCRACNKGWADDEAHFRNVLAIAGEPNASRRELWKTSIRRSFDKVDGIRRATDVIKQMKPIHTSQGIRHKIYPGKDERVVRVVRKIVRGLCYEHKVMTPVSDKRVWVDILNKAVPQEFLDQMKYHHREQDIAEYRYQSLNEDGINSAWLITFFERVTFIALVSMSEHGFVQII
jgi:hypothetical protein